MDEGRPLFVQIAEQIESQVLDGSLPENAQAPSTNELASFYRINPATALKGVTMLVDKGVLVKRRGVGMFVADGARELVRTERRSDFSDRYLTPLLAEADALGLSRDDVVELITTAATDPERTHP